MTNVPWCPVRALADSQSPVPNAFRTVSIAVLPIGIWRVLRSLETTFGRRLDRADEGFNARGAHYPPVAVNRIGSEIVSQIGA